MGQEIVVLRRTRPTADMARAAVEEDLAALNARSLPEGFWYEVRTAE